ncbi:hypothetical protein ACJMK2_036119 [Sinanodonta woodiana]|uniref:G-protein coupled receptors family 1 profile domain-containing protein n=1 Tax=Sinanodonta woodiana TaxID=1069815 RepID=A0ABD3WKB6_SINWO
MKKPQTVVLILVGVWTYSTIWALLPFLGWGSYGPEPFHTSCSIDWIGKSVSAQTYVWFIFISIVVLPVLVMAYSYYHVLVTVRTQVTPIAPEAVSTGPPSRVAHPAHGITFERGIDRRANKIVFVTMLLYCIAWLPYAVLSMLSTVGVHLPDMMTMIPCILAKSQCAFNPIVYLITHRPFRHSFYHICRCNPSMYINENASQIERNQLELIIDETRM